MKKRHAALAALALVGILSGCGQTKTQPADNTIAIAPVEKKANTAQVDMSVKYDFPAITRTQTELKSSVMNGTAARGVRTITVYTR